MKLFKRFSSINDNKQNLLDNSSSTSPNTKTNCFKTILNKCYCRKKTQVSSKRKNSLLFNQEKRNMPSNYISNTKYSIFTFLPLVLLNQFSFFSNQFYLALVISQLIPFLKIGDFYVLACPLFGVLAFTLIREAVDDIIRYFRDKRVNNEEYKKITKNGDKTIKSKDIKVGDLLILDQKCRIPADIIILISPKDTFIKTDQLDGESDLKKRKALKYTYSSTNCELLLFDAKLNYDFPSNKLYEFKGLFKINKYKESIGLDNTIWANSTLMSSSIVGLVIYTGKETRSQMNISNDRYKIGSLDYEINTYNKFLMILLLVCCLLLLSLKGFENSIYRNFIVFFRYIILLNTIIPLSLRVNLDLCKVLNTLIINKNKIIPNTYARNSTITEELGRVEIMFCDKTGTLTKNEMKLKRMIFQGQDYDLDDFENLKENLFKIYSQNIDNLPYKCKFDEGFKIDKIKETVLGLVICNSVVPYFINENDLSYKSNSQDDIALVKAARNLNMKLINRSDEIRFVNCLEKEEKFEILIEFPFKSEEKRMGIIIKDKKDNSIKFFLKGADQVLTNKIIKKEYKSFIEKKTKELANLGLRTLVLCYKELSINEYDEFSREYEEANCSLIDSQKLCYELRESLENDMEFLTILGIEDTLQDNVFFTIRSFIEAGIKVCMITGDRVETAVNISISCGLKKNNKNDYYITEDYDPIKIEEKLKYLKEILPDSTTLVVDGESIEIILTSLRPLFIDAINSCNSILFCRCTPKQKSKIVKTFKKYFFKKVLAIGDGGNDVSMLKVADIGIGLEGKEGMQASLASDFSITDFQDLKTLLFWFGRNSYINTSKISIFTIHRGLLCSGLQIIFSISFYSSTLSFYNTNLIVFLTTFYTNFAVLNLILNKDFIIDDINYSPIYYKNLVSQKQLSIKTFIFMIGKALYQSLIIYCGGYYASDNDLSFIVSCSFTSFVLVELVNIYLEIDHIHYSMIINLLLGVLSYFLSIYLFPNFFQIRVKLTLKFILQVSGTLILSNLPFCLSKRIIKRNRSKNNKSMIEIYK